MWKSYLKPKFLNDKETHALYGFFIFLIFWFLINIHVSLILVHVIAISVELWDYFSKKGTPEFLDYLYTVILPTLIYVLISL
jgi:hypothetical protein